MKLTAFYNTLRDNGLLGAELSQGQVDGIKALLDAGAGLPVAHVANVLAQVWRETGGGMYPVKETVYPHSKNRNPSDKTVIVRLDRAWAKGQLPWVKSAYWRDGYFGRGQIQITHDYNYKKSGKRIGVDLTTHPEKALELENSGKIAVLGMVFGDFTGKKLSDYDTDNGFDHIGARRIVNGDANKKGKGSKITVGGQIRDAAIIFGSALELAQWAKVDTNAPKPVKPTKGPFTAILAVLVAIFGGTK